MFFNSIDFAVFLPIVFFLYWYLANKNLGLQNLLIVIASYFFYGWWDWRFLSLILISTIVDYLVGIGISKQSNTTKRKMLLFASILVNKIKAVTKVLKKTHRFAGFAVLKAPDVPSVLVELGFLSNSTDEKNLRSKAFRKKLSRSMLGAIDQYFSQVQQARTN